MEQTTGPLEVGSVLDRYAIGRWIGGGAFGDVYEATHLELGKRVAIKALRPEHARHPEVLARFVREGRAAARIRHPNVVEVFDVGMRDGVAFLVMERLRGEDLERALARSGPMSTEAAVAVILPVVAAIAAAHDEGVTHRDLKPANLFLARTRDGETLPKVLDFGISHIAGGCAQRRWTREGDLIGSPAYMAPEQVRGAAEVTARSDQYALGVILYECVAGRPAFYGESVYAVLARVAAGDAPPLAALRPEVSAAFAEVVARAMAVDPAARFASVRELGRALLPFADTRTRLRWDAAFDPADARTLVRAGPARGTCAAPSTDAAETLVAATAPPRAADPARARAVALALGGVGILAGVLAAALARAIGPRPLAATAPEFSPRATAETKPYRCAPP